MTEFMLRVARPGDKDGVTAVLANAYPNLMAPDYDPAVLAATLPALTVANPGLLASGTYYLLCVQAGAIVSCGGWTHEQPGTNRVEVGVAHLRHFATLPDWTRKGLGKRIFERCRQDAREAGIHTITCFSSLNAEGFYASLGFRTVERTQLTLRNGLQVPSITMMWTDPLARP